jgi:hypothetical protein
VGYPFFEVKFFMKERIWASFSVSSVMGFWVLFFRHLSNEI